MQEKNRHIIIEAINKLPQHKAPDFVWENIETSLLSVPANSLPVHEAPVSTWSSIESGMIRQSFYNRIYRISLIALVVVVISAAGIIYFSGSNSSNITPPQNSNNIFPVISQDEPEEKVIAKTEKSEDDVITTESVSEDELEDKEISTINIVTPDNEVPIEIEDEVRMGWTGEKLFRLKTGFNFLENTYENKEIHPIDISPDDMLTANSPEGGCNFHGPDCKLLLGVNTEYMNFLNKFEPDNANTNSWLATRLAARYYRDRLSIETGIGLAFSKDKLDHSYSYLSKELVYSYEYVDSVYVDPVTGQVQYYTTTVDVYDSVLHSNSIEKERKYTYLQIPVLIGCDVTRYRNIIFTVRAGVTFFTQLKKKEVNPDLFHENSRIINPVSDEVIRKKNFLKGSASISAKFMLNEYWNVTFSPTFHYFFGNIYEKGKSKNPYALGFRVGIYYKF